MATTKQLVIKHMNDIRTLIAESPSKEDFAEPSTTVQRAREALAILASHICNDYCNDHNVCSKEWRKVDSGVYLTFQQWDTTVMIPAIWFKYGWLDESLINLYIDLEDAALDD